MSLNFMFDGISPLFQPSWTTEPSICVPEFYREFAVLAESVCMLDGVGALLVETTGGSDSRVESFRPASASFAFIRGQLSRL
jgi:hypothetical protein